MSNATEKELGELHGFLANKFKDMLVTGIPMVKITKDGEKIEYTRPVTASELNTIRQFLKDNNIETVRESKALKGIVDNLPFPEVDTGLPDDEPENGSVVPFPSARAF